VEINYVVKATNRGGNYLGSSCYEELNQKIKRLNSIKTGLSQITLTSYEQAFNVEFAHHSTAIEGNTLSLIEAKLVIEDGLAVGGKSLREIYEIVNHSKAFMYVQSCVANKKTLDEQAVKEIHALLMENILTGGVYRDVNVYISGARHTPPPPPEMYRQIKDFYIDLMWKADSLNPIELAAWTHAEFVKIHPFVDGNGRTSRLLMNYQLMANGFLPIIIAKENRLAYFNALEQYAVENNLSPFMDIIAGLENEQVEKYFAMA